MRIFRVIKELINYRYFKKTIKKASVESPKWTKLKLRRDWLNRVYTVVNLPPTITNSAEFPAEARPSYVMEELDPINKYLSEDLQLQELITVRMEPIEEVNGDAFLVVYFYLFRELTILWILRNILLVTLLIVGLSNLDAIIETATQLFK